MRKLFVSLALSIGATMIATASAGAPSSPSTGSARLHPIDQSGVHARISIVDTHDELVGLIITGTATGLDPDKAYLSGLIPNGAVPGGPRACKPVGPIDEERNFTVRWVVEEDGTGTLFAVQNEGGYIPLADIDTVSILEVTVPGRPDLFPVVACGQINKHK